MIDLASYIDSTNLKPEARQIDIEELCREALEHHMAAVCVHPYRLPLGRRLLAGTTVHLCTVVGFPLGADGLASKAYSASTALGEGADELDMVINIGAVKDRDYRTVGKEIEVIAALKQEYRFILKVIIETAYLNHEELAELIRLINQTEADFVKTSTGFGPRGASLEDITNIIKYRRPPLKIKASGGIRDLDQALAMIEAGADRLGTSSAGQLLKEYRAAR
ncbi:MAG: deoxyribose-phosphate aldolase [Syntrophomonadaceae bacterium]